MKNFNQLVNESSGLKLTRDYSRFLLEQQAFVAKKTCAILFGEETDYDGSDDKSNDPPFTSHLSGQFYVHINLDGRRKIKTANTAQEAALLTKDYPGSVIYNFKGDEVDPNQVKMTESVERFNIFEDEAYDYTKSESKKRAPEDESGILNSIANAWRSKEKGAAVAMANNNSFIARNLQNLQNALTGIGAFGADRTPEQTMQERDAEVKKLRDRLDAYEMEQRGKGFRNVEDIPLSDEETKDVQTFIKQRQEQQDRVGPMMPGVAERVVGLPREQLKAYKDFYKTATAYQGKALQDYYDQNPDKYSAHEPYMDTKTAVALKPISRSEDEGSSMPGRLKGTSFDSAAKVVAGLPETAAMLAAGIVAPELVGGLVGGAGRIVPAIARVSSGAAAKAATAQAINTAVGLAGVDKLANAKDVVQGAEGAVMAAAIGDPLFKSTSPNPAAHKNAIDLWNAKLKAELTRTLAGQKGAYETSAMIRREVPTGAKEGTKRTGPSGEYPKVAETQPTTEWPGVSTNPRTIETGGKASETAGQVANEEIPLLLRNLETRAWRDYETFDPAVVRQAARDRVAGRLGSGQPEILGTRPSVPSENPPAARETVPLRVTDTGTYKDREKERTKAENKEKERIETEMRKGRVNPEQTSSRPSFADTVDALKGTIQKAGTELVNWMKPKPGTSVQRRALTPSSELALYPKRTASEVLADTKYATEKPLGVLRQAAKDISTGVKERGAAETAAQLAAVAPQVVSTVIPDMPTPPAIRASAPDVWKPSSNMELMTTPVKGPRANANPEPISVTPQGEVIRVTPESKPVDRTAIDNLLVKLIPTAANRPAPARDSWKPATSIAPMTVSGDGAPAPQSRSPEISQKPENFRVTPEPTPVNRAAIDSFVKSLLPSAANRTTSTQPTNNVPPPTTAPSTASDTSTTAVPSTVTNTTTTSTTAPAPTTSSTTATTATQAPVTAPTVAPAEAPTNTPDTSPVTNPIVNNIVQSIIAAAAIGGGSKLLPGKKGGGGGGGGGGSGGGLGGGSGEREELKRQQQELDSKAKNWDLLIKNIWGKNVETLTK
jgi:hypothetical protein